MSSSWSGRPRARWWAIFVPLVALPAVALAVAGFGAISADRIERENLWRQQAASTTQLAGSAIGTALSRLIAADPVNPIQGVTHFERDAHGALLFQQDRVYIANFGVVPVSLGPSLSAPEAGSDIPAEIVDALGGGRDAVEHRRTVLGRLRAGSWWLHLDQRRAYDRELVRLLGDATHVPASDARLDELARLEALIGAQPIAAGSGSVALPVTDGVELIAWSRDREAGTTGGVVMSPARARNVLSSAIEGLADGQGVNAEVRDGHGVVVWRVGGPVADGTDDAPLAPVTGLLIRLSPREADGGAFPWRAYGLVVLPLVVLAFGLVTMTRVMKREVDLARRQAEFTAAVTHEFKSPITSLRLLMERISAGHVQGGEALAGYHRAIEQETSRLDTLVTRLLETQAIQQGHGEAPRRAGPIEPLLCAALDQCRHHAESKGIALELTVDPGLPDLLVDGPRVTDAVLNLVENALKYSSSGSRVSVTARAVDAEVQVTVSDQGAGIHKDDMPHIFEPYYRGRLGDRESVRGTGLGLALVQATAAAHGGRVDVASEPGQGSRFTLRLPIQGGA